MKESLLEQIISSGVKTSDDLPRQRSVKFSNYISLILGVGGMLLFVLIPQNHNFGGFRESLISVVIFSVPIMLNRVSLINSSRTYLCWVPPLLVTWDMISAMQAVQTVNISTYSGLRIYLLAASCIPYLLLDRKNISLFIIGVLPTLLLILFFDSFLDVAGVGFQSKGMPDSGYEFNQARSIIAYVIICGSCFSLRLIIDRTDYENQELIHQLEHKNTIIKSQAESEQAKLNKQLRENITELTKREIMLKRSQEIAKIGNWEYNLRENTLFWSDQMYEIFGLDKNFKIHNPDINAIVFRESGALIDNAFQELLAKRKSYDFTLKTQTPLGYTKWVRLFAFPIIENNEIISASGIVHDITLFKESEERVIATESTYRSFFEQATDAIMLTDFSGKFLDINTSLCNLLGYTRAELLLMSMKDILVPEDLKQRPLMFARLAEGEHIFAERRFVKRDGSIFHVESNVKMVDEGKILVISRDVTGKKEVENEKELTRYALNERVKELTTLYRAGLILQIESKPIHEVLQELVSILPAGWQYPEITAARISYAEMEFLTPNFASYKGRQIAEFKTRNELFGTVEVIYLDDKPDEAEGPFLAEERNLLNMIADMIRIYLSRRNETEALRRSEANQSATINNSNLQIWSVNRENELISFNKKFAEFIKEQYNLDARLGNLLLDSAPHLSDIKDVWRSRYNRAFSGEAYKVQSELGGRLFEYSLNPIRGDGKILGVSVFGEDITDRVDREQELLRINKQLGELKLMALRSVMNPHFVFNCLNSIQYYIMQSDQLNAVTYLSTFSKLIRSILNNSVHNRIKLAEEIEMLGHYIQLESLRFEGKFDSAIEVSPDLDTDSIEIPSMLIQPYVENAILHGLNAKKEKGLLKISVASEDNMILVEIEDNGIGRAATAKLKTDSLTQHKSMGTALTEERLKLINANSNVSVEIIDLEINGTATGTKVKVWIQE